MWPFNLYSTYTLQSLPTKEFDYIVVGGGTAGCVLAARLSEDKDVSVLLLERGPVITSWISRVPLLSTDYHPARSPTYKWQSAPLDALGGTRFNMVAGKAMGGTSKVNIFLYTRSIPGEYNAWAEAGREGWSWRDVEPYFVKSETSLSNSKGFSRGTQGPWVNQRIEGEIFFESIKQTAEAAETLGIPLVERANDPDEPAFSCVRLDRTIDRQMRRLSTFDAFLPPEVVQDRKQNLFICPETIVCKIAVDRGIATGIYARSETASSTVPPTFLWAKREVIVCAGATVTPQLLMLSGIGPAGHLKEHGIPIVKDLPGVGSHLQDHLGVSVVFKAPLNDNLHILLANPFKAVWELLKYLLWGIGLFLAPNPQIAIFTLSRLLDGNSRTVANDKSDFDSYSSHNIPDVEIIPIPHNSTDFTFKGLGKSYGAFSYLCVALRPTSTGTVRLASTDPHAPPICDLGTLTDTADYVPLRKAVKLALALGRQLHRSGYPLNDLLVPESESQEDLDAFIRHGASTTFHYTSSCRMAPEAEQGVVDDQLRVHGVGRLRVADASVFPTIPACHTQAPTVMVAERCADFVRRGRELSNAARNA